MTPVRTLATVRHHGMELADHEFTVPLDHDAPAGETLTIFARAVKHSDLPVDASSGSSRSLHYRWVAAALGQPRRLLPAHISRSATQDAEVLRALSGRSRALRTDPRVSAPARGHVADRWSADGPSLSAARLHARLRRWHGESPLPARDRILRRRGRRRIEPAFPAHAREFAAV